MTVLSVPPRTLFAGPRFFSSAADEPYRRRPTDLLLALAGALVAVSLALLAPDGSVLGAAVQEAAESAPGSLAWLWSAGFGLLLLWAAVIVGASALRRWRRRLLAHYAVSVTASVVLLAGAGWVSGASTSVLGSPALLWLAAATSVVVTASPHVARPFRWVGRALVWTAAASALLLGAASPWGVLTGLVVGMTAGALTHLAFGSPGGHPTAAGVAAALADLGLDVLEVRDAPAQVPGMALYAARTADDDALVVTVFGRDAWDGQVVTSVWTALWRRGERPHLGRGRHALVEHEALATVLAERAGVPVQPVVAVGRSADGDAVLVTRARGRTLAASDAADVDDHVLRALWRAVVAMHAVGMAHGRIDGDRLVVDPGGGVALADLGEAEITASPAAALIDRARLLVATALVVGPERAVAAAVAVLGPAELAEFLPYLQPPVLAKSARRRLHDCDWNLPDLVAAAAGAADVEAPEPMPVQRVTPRSLVIATLLTLFAWAIISWLVGLDLAAIWAELQSADWAVLCVALAVAPTIPLAQAVSTLGASTAALRYGPVALLQYAIQFISLTLPSTAARVGLEVRFFQRFGIGPGAAVSMGVIDSVSGFAVQLALLLLVLLTDLPGFTTKVLGQESSASTETTSDPSLLAVLLVLGVVAIALALLVPRSRHYALGRLAAARASVREQLVAARGSFVVLRRPRKLGEMLGGNLAAQLIEAFVLGVCLAAFGETAAFSQLVLINTVVCLFGGLMPVPGNIGVAEAGYTLGLQAIGVPAEVAVSVAIAFRLVTFYLPPIWGAASLRWLQRHAYV
jgi:uncharacterized membrane protein YbhN (UPF0104 family)